VPGRTFMVENYDPMSAVSYWRGGELAWRNWLGAVRSADEAAWFAPDDLRPFELMCLRMGWRMLARPVTERLKRPRRRLPVASGPDRMADTDRPAGPRVRPGRATGRGAGGGAGASQAET
jgi:D-aspartate ligase